MASAKSAEYDKVIGLTWAPTIIFPKPFGMMEMVSRVKALLRRTSGGEPEKLLSIGDLEMNPPNTPLRSAANRGFDLKGIQSFKIIFGAQRGLFFPRKLLSEIWEEQFMGETRTVDVHIGTLRSKLGKWGTAYARSEAWVTEWRTVYDKKRFFARYSPWR